MNLLAGKNVIFLCVLLKINFSTPNWLINITLFLKRHIIIFTIQVFYDNEAQYLLKDIMSFSPIWSCCFGPIHQHASNSEVENNFFQIKSHIRGLKTEAEFSLERFKMVKNEVASIVILFFLFFY